MNIEFKPRLNHIDLDSARLALRNRNEHLPELLQMMQEEPEKLPQTRYLSLASGYQSIAMFSYGLGYPLKAVRESLTKAGEAYLKVFELRGTESPFPVMVFKYDPTYPSTDPRSTVEFRPLHPEDAKDYSVTNSRSGYIAVCMALMANQHPLAERLAEYIWDPPGAKYVSLKSESCTPNDQRLAYALQSFFQGNSEAALVLLSQIRRRPKEIDVVHQAAMVRGLATDDAGVFLQGLSDLLAWHEKAALKKWNREPKPYYFICVPGLALCTLAVRRGLLTSEQLPQDNVYLPLKLPGLIPSKT